MGPGWVLGWVLGWARPKTKIIETMIGGSQLTKLRIEIDVTRLMCSAPASEECQCLEHLIAQAKVSESGAQ